MAARSPGSGPFLGIANATAAVGFALLGPVDWATAAPLAVVLLAGGRLGPVVVRTPTPACSAR